MQSPPITLKRPLTIYGGTQSTAVSGYGDWRQNKAREACLKVSWSCAYNNYTKSQQLPGLRDQ